MQNYLLQQKNAIGSIFVMRHVTKLSETAQKYIGQVLTSLVYVKKNKVNLKLIFFRQLKSMTTIGNIT